MSRRKPGAPIELTIDAIANGGEGVGRHDGRRVFVANTAQGDRVRVQLGEPARLLEVLAPSADRIDARCADVARCGGCDWMHLHADVQSREHRARAERLLGTVTHHVRADACGPRERVRLHFQGGRLGYFRARSAQLCVPRQCHVLATPLERARHAFAALLPSALRGELALACDGERVTAHLTIAEGEPDARLVQALEAALSTEIAGVRVQVGDSDYAFSIGDPTPSFCAADDRPLQLPSGGFSQSSARGNRALAARLMHHAQFPQSNVEVLELYAGAGNFSVLLAAHTTRLTTYEAHREASELARKNLAARGLSAKIHCGDASAATIPKKLPLLVLDPPRIGAKGVLAAADRARAQRILYVSCNPLTLARDAQELGADYRLDALELFELFGETHHVETLAVWSRV